MFFFFYPVILKTNIFTNNYVEIKDRDVYEY